MPRYNVEYNGKWACYTSISDGWITPFMSKDEYEKWRMVEYGSADYAPAEKRNRMTIQEAVFSASLNRDHVELIEIMQKSGLSQTEIEKLVYDIETEYYCPIPDEMKGYKCPNCSCTVEYGQKECQAKDCNNRFVWRM